MPGNAAAVSGCWTWMNRAFILPVLTLIELYNEAYGTALGNMKWFRALAAYKFSIITGLNLSLHRRGKREDPLWKDIDTSMTPLIERAHQLLSG